VAMFFRSNDASMCRMSLFAMFALGLLSLAGVGTVVWGIILTRQIKAAPDLKTRSGVKGTALIVRNAIPCLLVAFLILISVLLHRGTPSIYPILAMFVVLILFYVIIYLVSRDQVGAEYSRVSTGKSTWRGKRALRWARESVIAMGLMYVLFLSLLLIAW